MIIYLVGVGCVGKTTIGRSLAEKLGYLFFDVDEEVEKYYAKPIEVIQDECYSMNGYREKASIVLDNLFSNTDRAVIAGTPSGLKYSFLPVYKKYKKRKEIISIHLTDKPENIVERLIFYDKESRPIHLEMDGLKKKKYCQKIIEDYNYFRASYERADFQVSIQDVCLEDIPGLILNSFEGGNFNF